MTICFDCCAEGAVPAKVSNPRRQGCVCSTGALPKFGVCRVTPWCPHGAHRAEWRSLLLETSGSHRMINGTIAIGLRVYVHGHLRFERRGLRCLRALDCATAGSSL